MLDKVKKFIFQGEEDDENVVVDEQPNNPDSVQKPKNNPKVTKGDNEMTIFEPRTFEDARMIADKIKTGVAAVVNIEKLGEGMAQRTLDFISGVVYALNGSIHKASDKVYVYSPNNVVVDRVNDKE